MVCFLGIAWVAFATSLVLILISFLTSQRALRYEMKAGPNPPAEERAGGKDGTFTQNLNIASAVALGVGVVTLIIFALYNI
jgi:multisubunit Na+/H+ antiporter MnhB subunit